MADARKCDICGKYYSLDYTSGERPAKLGNYVDGLKIMCWKSQCSLGEYDLCENCANDLMAFIRQHKKEEVND